jgi:tol-pal system protein YbgF
MKTTLQQVGRNAVLGLLLGIVPVAAGAQKLEDRLTRIERLLDSGALMEMVNQQEQLRRTLQELQGEVELLRRDLSEVKQRQHDLYLDTDRRLRQLETAATQPRPAPAPTAGEQPAIAAADDDTQSPPPGAADNELADYQAAFGLLKAGRYADAAVAFQEFLERYPTGQYTANALYWLGESYYVVRDFGKAMPYFRQVLSEHAASAKGPDALLKIGFIHHEQGDIAQARQVLERVKADYPNTTAATLAEQRLLRLSAR